MGLFPLISSAQISMGGHLNLDGGTLNFDSGTLTLDGGDASLLQFKYCIPLRFFSSAAFLGLAVEIARKLGSFAAKGQH